MTCRIHAWARWNGKNALDAANAAGEMTDQWATVNAIDSNAFDRDANKGYRFQVLQGKGIAVFALAWGIGCECFTYDASTPFGIANERRRMEAWVLMEDCHNVRARGHDGGRIKEDNTPGAAVISSDSEYTGERLSRSGGTR